MSPFQLSKLELNKTKGTHAWFNSCKIIYGAMNDPRPDAVLGLTVPEQIPCLPGILYASGRKIIKSTSKYRIFIL